MKGFIEITETDRVLYNINLGITPNEKEISSEKLPDLKVLIAVKDIIKVASNTIQTYDYSYTTKESYEEIKQLIKNATNEN